MIHFRRMTDCYSNLISIFALAVSALTAWYTIFRIGKVKMTQPTVIFFGPDGGRSDSTASHPKIFLRTLLVSTSQRGRIIESMHVAVTRNETHQNFNIWVYGDKELVRGSGLFVGQSGIATNHHFLLPEDNTNFCFTEGQYKLEVFARLLGNKEYTRLFLQKLEISRDLAASLLKPNTGLYFDWGPDSMSYFPHIKQSIVPNPDEFLKMLGIK
jgi:hypothetical protein